MARHGNKCKHKTAGIAYCLGDPDRLFRPAAGRSIHVFLPASTAELWRPRESAASPLLRLSRSARKHGSDALGIDVEGQEGEWLIARTAPLVHEIERLVDQ